MKTVFALALALAFAVAALSAGADAQTVRATRVTAYVPVIPRGAPVSGSCWTRSIAAPSRTDAYRCMVRNEIYDPCFAPNRAGLVVCDVNPALRKAGFPLRLTKPLPNEPTFNARTAMPWLVALADGEICIPLTGTHELLGRETVGYECSEPRALPNDSAMTGLIDGSIRPGRVWHARKAVYRLPRSGPPTGKISVVPLAAVWR